MTLLDVYADTYGDVYGEASDTFPNVKVEFAWLYDPNDNLPAWVEHEGWRSIEITRGRQLEHGAIEAGTATVVFSDSDRELDPTNELAVYSGSLLPMRRMRVRATFDGTTYPLFYGYIDSFSHAYAGPHDGDITCTITATDGFGLLEAAELPGSVYAVEVAYDEPLLWWRLNEPDSTEVVYNYGVGGRSKDGTVDRAGLSGAPSAVRFGVEGLIALDDDTAFQPSDENATTHGGVYLSVAKSDMPLDGSSPFTIEFWFRYLDDPTSGVGSILETYGGGSPGVEIRVFGGELVIAATNSAFTAAVGREVAIAADVTYHVVALIDASAAAAADVITVYVDNVETGALSAGSSALGGDIQPGDLRLGYEVEGATSRQVVIDEFAIYDGLLSEDRISAHFGAGSGPWQADTPGERIFRILDVIGFPGSLQDVDTGTAVLQSAELGGTALGHLQKVADSDFGVLFMSAEGELTFIGRASLWNRPSEGVFGDDPDDPTELGYRTLTPQYGALLIRNDVVVSRANGTAQRVEDTASIVSFSRRTWTIDGLLHDDDAMSLDTAHFMASEYAQPRRRISNLVIAPTGNPTDLFPQVLGRELLDNVTVFDRPAGGGPNEQDSSIEGIAHTIAPGYWETTWNLAPEFGSLATGECIFEIGDQAPCGIGEGRIAF